tara:strand:+ start:945 stop:1481 length:537 start_codon:yes stop_codon:yes gene_type:complete
MIDLEQDAPVPKNEDLAGIAELAKMQELAQEVLADLENKLELAKAQLKTIQEVELPETMLALGLKSFTLSDGSKLEIKTFYRGNITKKNEAAAHAWLKENGHDDLIKNEVKCSFGKGEDEEAAELMKVIEDFGADYENKKSVHPSTLKAFVREQIEEGGTLPLDLLGVHIGQRSEIRR